MPLYMVCVRAEAVCDAADLGLRCVEIEARLRERWPETDATPRDGSIQIVVRTSLNGPREVAAVLEAFLDAWGVDDSELTFVGVGVGIGAPVLA